MNIPSSGRCSSGSTFAAVLKGTQHLLCSPELELHLGIQPSLPSAVDPWQVSNTTSFVLQMKGKNKHARYKTLAVMKAPFETPQTV